MDQRPADPGDPAARRPEADADAPPLVTPAPMPWERQAEPSSQPPSSILSADPVLSADPATRPEVAWAPPPDRPGLAVPGADGFVYASTVARFAAWILDNLIVGVVAFVIGVALTVVLRLESARDAFAVSVVLYGLDVLLSAIYFIGQWTSARRATLGMRAFGLQLGAGAEGRRLSPGSAFVRWVALGSPLTLLLLVPAIANVAALILVVLPIVLLISTVTSPTKQGLHDRAAGSIVVQPAARTNSGATACLVVVVVVLLISLLSIVALIYLGSQVEDILREAGNSV